MDRQAVTTYYQDDEITLHLGDALEAVSALPESSVDCIVTSPPYYGLRDYGQEGQYGREATVDEYVQTLVDLFRECRRVLTCDGTFWLNLGDTYRNKRLLMVPARVALALQDDGWIQRNEIVWHKTNGMPTQVKDRFANKHERVFLFSKSPRYWFDLDPVRAPHDPASVKIQDQARARYAARLERGEVKEKAKADGAPGLPTQSGFARGLRDLHPKGANPGDVWSLGNTQFRGVHFAPFNPEVPRRAILSGCKPGGVVLDPFSGSATTGMVALELGRKYIGVDINPEYHDLALGARLARNQLDLGGAA